MSLLTNKTVILTYKYLFTCLIYVIASAVVLNIFMHKNFLDNTPKNEVGVCLEYNAVKPWCYRVLVPFSVNTIKVTADQIGITNKASKLIKYSKVQDRVEKMKIRYEFKEYVDIANYFIIYGLFFLILLSLLFALRKLTQLLFECHELVYLLAPVIILLLYPLSFVGSGNLYDFLEILFLILALIYLLQEKWALYYLVFGLAILNKESSILLGIYVVAVYFKVYSTKKLASHALLHLIIGLPIFLTIRILFEGNPGGQFWKAHPRPDLNYVGLRRPAG